MMFLWRVSKAIYDLLLIIYTEEAWIIMNITDRQVTLLSTYESVKFSLIESVIFLFTDSSVKKYFSLLNQFIFTDSSVKKYFSLSN